MKYVLYMHSGSGNRGCEAIVKTTSSLIGKPEDNVLWSFHKDEDVQTGLEKLYSRIVVSEEMKRGSAAHIESLFRRKVLRQSDANLKVFLRELFKDNVAVCVGGDNYCYPWSAKQAVELNREIRKYAKATVLWGCSVEKEAINEDVKEDLRQYSLITAREPLTYNLLKEINPNTIKVSDPAFTLDTEKLPLPENFIEGNTAGINVSPLIMKYGEGSLILENYRKLIRFILNETDMNICLIPHVFWKDNNDLEPIEALYQEFEADHDRISVIRKGTASQLKGYIARCRFFIGARTHATIAAYSSCVPTLVAGYSVKSIGIAQDLFGTDENYVLPVQKFDSPDGLAKCFAWLMANENSIRNHLQEIMPDYIQNAYKAADALRQL